MAQGSRTALAGAVVAVTGLIPLALMAASPGQPPVTTDAAQQVAATTTSTIVVPLEVETGDRAGAVITTPPPVISGVSESVARVLASSGFAGEEQVTGLPASVTAVLRDNNAVLTIAVEGAP